MKTMTEIFCNLVVEQLISHLESSFEIQPFENGCIIVSPFTYSDLASIEFAIEPIGGGYLLTDHGETLNMLFVSGLTVEPNRQLLNQVQHIANARGVQFERSALSVIASEEQLGEAAYQLLDAIQAVGFLIYKRKSHIYTTFDDEVEEFLIENEVVYDTDKIVRGRANTHKLKFFVNSNRNLLLEPISAATIPSARNKAKAAAYKFMDIREVIPSYRFTVIVDDREKRWETIWSDDEAFNAISVHADQVVRWVAQRDDLMKLVF